MYSHEGPKLDAKYLESVKADQQFQGVLTGIFHLNFLNGADFLEPDACTAH
jgi:hypothetical protein